MENLRLHAISLSLEELLESSSERVEAIRQEVRTRMLREQVRGFNCEVQARGYLGIQAKRYVVNNGSAYDGTYLN